MGNASGGIGIDDKLRIIGLEADLTADPVARR